MSGKPKDYFWAFVIGGSLSILAQLVLMAFESAGIPYGVCLTLTMAAMAVFGFIFTVIGLYEKWEGLGGMGGMLPFSGLLSVIIETTGAKLGEGKPLKEAALAGLRGPFWIFGIGVPFCMLLALAVHVI